MSLTHSLAPSQCRSTSSHTSRDEGAHRLFIPVVCDKAPCIASFLFFLPTFRRVSLSVSRIRICYRSTHFKTWPLFFMSRMRHDVNSWHASIDDFIHGFIMGFSLPTLPAAPSAHVTDAQPCAQPRVNLNIWFFRNIHETSIEVLFVKVTVF